MAALASTPAAFSQNLFNLGKLDMNVEKLSFFENFSCFNICFRTFTQTHDVVFVCVFVESKNFETYLEVLPTHIIAGPDRE